MNDRKRLVKAIAEDKTEEATQLFEKLISERLNLVLDTKKQEVAKKIFTNKTDAASKR